MRHTAKIPPITMSFDIVRTDGEEIDNASLARAEFVEGVKAYAGMVVGKYGVTETDVYDWLIDMGDQAKSLRENKEEVKE